jgi:signal transduction histidine kinase
MRTSHLTDAADEITHEFRRLREPGPEVAAKAIAHDLNNVFSLIKMASELLRTSPVGPDGERFLDIIDTGLSRAAGISGRVLALSKGAR